MTRSPALPRSAAAERRARLLRRAWRGFWILVLCLVVLLHVAGGWHFSNVLFEDALALDPFEPARDVEVAAMEGDLVTLRPLGADDASLHRPGVFGFEHAAGYLRLRDVVRDDGEVVTRAFEVLEGEMPEPGTAGDVQAFAFPDDPAVAGLEVEEVTYRSPLGPMSALYLPGQGTDWVVHVHGKGSLPREAFRLMRPLAEAGFHQLALTYRNDPGQPEDPSGTYQYGRTEWEDLVAALRLVEEEGGEQVVLVGYSTGAAIALSALFKSKPELVEAVVLDSPNLDMSATVDLGASRRQLAFGLPLPPTLTATAKFLAGVRYGLNWQAIDYLRRAGQLVVPTLVLHGTEDDSVPLETSRRLALEREQLVTLVTVPGAGHVESWNVDPDGYERQVLRFLSEHLEG